MSIASELMVMAANKAAIKAAIEAKNPETEPGGDMSNWADSIASIPEGGGGSGGDKPVKFRDCDGTVLYSYTPEETAKLTELPALPTRTGLSCQGWNWTLQQVKDYVGDYGACEVSAVYTTDDGKTRIKLTIRDPKYSTIPLVFQQTVANGVAVNWGDGSEDETYESTEQLTISHTYTPVYYPSTYTVTFEVKSGTMSFPTNIMGKTGTVTGVNRTRTWGSMIEDLKIGNRVIEIGDYAFSYCPTLSNITIPSSVTSIGRYAFKECVSLTDVTIPSSVTSIGSSAFNNCASITGITIPSSVTNIGSYTFQYCSSLTSITIPSSVTSIGEGAFYHCSSITTITIPPLVTSIGQFVFVGCSSLTSITIPSSVTSIGDSAFKDCDSLTNIMIPSSVTSIDSSAFYSCDSLTNIMISSSITRIGDSTFRNCDLLTRITIPSSVTTIDNLAFAYSHGLITYDFRTSTSVPTLANVKAFQESPPDKEIIVPDELYETWKTSTNWSSTTNNIVNCIVKASESSLGPL